MNVKNWVGMETRLVVGVHERLGGGGDMLSGR